MLLDRLRNGRRFASIHAGDLYLGKRSEQRIASGVALSFASAALRCCYFRKFRFEGYSSCCDSFQIARFF